MSAGKRSLATLASVVLAMSLASVAAAAPEPPTPLEIRLVDQDFAIARDAPWHARWRVDGTVPAAVVRVILYRPIDDRVDLADDLAGDRQEVIDGIVFDVAPNLQSDASGTLLGITVPTTAAANAAEALTLRRPGLYPVTVQLVANDTVVAEDHTFIERLPTDPSTAPPMNVALVAGIDDPGPAPTASELEVGRRRLAELAEFTTAVDGPVTVSIPPPLVADLATDDPELSAQLRQALAGDEVLSLPSDRLDPSSAVAIGKAETFTRRLRDGEDALGAALPGIAATRSGWLVKTPVSTDGATLLRDLGFDLLTLGAGDYATLDGNIGGFVDTTLAVQVALDDAGTMPAIVTSGAGELLVADEDIDPTAAAVRILAELLTTRRELGALQRRSVVLATSALAIPDPEVAGALATMATAVPDLRLTPLSALASSTDTMLVEGQPQTISLPPVAGPDLTERAQRVELTGVSAESAGSMRLDDSELQQWRAELDAALSTGLSDAQVDATLARVATEADAVRNSVVPPQPFDLTLTGRSSTLRLNLRNTSDETLRVVVQAALPEADVPRRGPDRRARAERGDRGADPRRDALERDVFDRDRTAHASDRSACRGARRVDGPRQRADRPRSSDHRRRAARAHLVVVRPPPPAPPPATGPRQGRLERGGPRRTAGRSPAALTRDKPRSVRRDRSDRPVSGGQLAGLDAPETVTECP